MIMDELLEFGDALALDTASTGLAAIGDVIDLGSGSPQDFGNGQPMYLVITVATSVDSAADGASVEFQVVSDAQDPPAADGTETVHLKSDAFPEATLAQGFTLCFPLPVGPDNDYERYLGIQQNVTGEAVTAGAINAFLTFDPKGWKAYADAVN